MTDILKKIYETKIAELKVIKFARTLFDYEQKAKIAVKPKGFAKALKYPKFGKSLGLIAEIKKASPSKGVIRSNFNPTLLAKAYQSGGADCLSVLTDETYFQGSFDDLIQARLSVDLPILRKDFLIDPIQVIETRGLGADAILIIMAMIDDDCAVDIYKTAIDWQMDVLVEIHNQAELERAIALFPANENLLLGINNRDLKSFELSLNTTKSLAKLCPPEYFLVSESGIFNSDDVKFVAKHGAKAILVGESLMRHEDLEQATKNLFC